MGEKSPCRLGDVANRTMERCLWEESHGVYQDEVVCFDPAWGGCVLMGCVWQICVCVCVTSVPTLI